LFSLEEIHEYFHLKSIAMDKFNIRDN